jgi:uncharacterized membrane protein YoaK (UPF0700 family)
VADDGPVRFESTLVLAAMLTAVTGFVDAHVYLNVARVFVANQSGNVVLTGIDIGEAQWSTVIAHLVSIIMFAAGVAIGTTVHERRVASGLLVHPDLVLVAEAVMLVGLVVARALHDSGPVVQADAVDDVIIAVGALAMGLQTVVIGRVGSVAVATTYESGAVARVGVEGALALRRGAPAEKRARHMVVVKVLLVMIVAYAAGAAAAAAVSSSPAWLLVPAAVVLVTSFPVRRLAARARREPTGAD